MESIGRREKEQRQGGHFSHRILRKVFLKSLLELEKKDKKNKTKHVIPLNQVVAHAGRI